MGHEIAFYAGMKGVEGSCLGELKALKLYFQDGIPLDVLNYDPMGLYCIPGVWGGPTDAPLRRGTPGLP